MCIRLLVLFLSLLFLSVVSNALTIQIKNGPSGDIRGFSSGYSQNGFTVKSFYLLRIMNKYQHTIKPKCFLRCCEDEAIIIESDNGMKLEILKKVSSRLMQLLIFGWRSVIQWQPSHGVDPSLQSFNPPCSLIFSYLLFGITNASKQTHFLCKKLIDQSIKESVLNNKLLPYSMLIIIYNDNHNDNNSFLYLGNNLFLSWSNVYGHFTFMSSEDIDRPHSLSNPKFMQVIAANGIYSPTIQILEMLINSVKSYHALK